MAGTFLFTLKLLCSVFGSLLLLRAYLRYLGIPGNDPLVSFAYSLTQWAVEPASKFIKRTRNIEWPSIFVCYLVAVIYQFFHWLMGSGHGGVWPFVFGSAVLVVYWAIELAMWATVLFCIFSWVNQASANYRTLSYLCYPILAPFKKVIPVWRNIDFSGVVFIILANIVLALITPLT
ncbi:YggT family protein [uncultured Parasutterella sp.]|uniref:YggT family protein n=1 Tax=uncultured Parasutterella sp. TaxID=1263098 RepID=UPI0034A183F2